MLSISDEPRRMIETGRAAPVLFALLAIVLSMPAAAQCPDESIAYVAMGSGKLIAVDLDAHEITVVASGLGTLEGIALDPTETTAYLTDSASGEVHAVDLATGADSVVASGLTTPSGIDVDASGVTAYVTDEGTYQVIAVTLATGAKKTVHSYTALQVPTDVVVNQAETLLYVTLSSGQVAWVDLATLGSTEFAAGLTSPGGIDLDGTEANAYVNTTADVFRVDLSTGTYTSIGYIPGAAGVDANTSDTRLFVAEMDNLLALALGPGMGHVVSEAEVTGAPADVALARAGCSRCPNERVIYVLDQGGIWRFDPISGMQSRVAVVSAYYMAVNTAAFRAYVTNSSTGELTEVDLLTGSTSTVATGLSSPRDVDLSADGATAYLIESGSDEISAVDLSSGTVTVVASVPAPIRLAVDTSGNAYVASDDLAGGGPLIYKVDIPTAGVRTLLVDLSGVVGYVNDMALNAAGTRLYIGDGATLGVLDIGSASYSVLSTSAPVFGGLSVNEAESLAIVSNVGSTGDGALGIVELNNPLAPLPLRWHSITGYDFDNLGGIALATTPCVTASIRPSIQDPGTGSQIATCAFLDMSYTPESLGGYGATLSWDPSVLTYSGSAGGTPPFDTPIVNATDADTGTLSFSDADPTGAAEGDTHVACARFDVVGATGSSTPLDLELTSLFGAGTFNDLLSIAGARDETIDVRGLCEVGDLNTDTKFNSGDALIVLAFELLLPVPASSLELLGGGCGDVNGDSFTDSIDANIILSSEVGLPVDPTFPFMSPVQTFDSCLDCASLPPPAEAAARHAPSATKTANSTITPRVNVLSVKPRRGELFDVVVGVDLGGEAVRLGSYGAIVSWDAKKMEFLGTVSGAPEAFAPPMVNAEDAAAGTLRFGQVDPVGAGGDLDLVTLRFRATRRLPRPEAAITLRFTSMGAPGPGFDSLLSLLPETALAPRTKPPAKNRCGSVPQP